LSDIRVTYSGLISLVIGFSTIVTGLIFTLIVTRSLTPEELGTWSLIGGLITYVIIIEPIISYWVLRETARGIKSEKTAVVTSAIFSVGASFAYLVIAYFVGVKTGADLEILLFAVFLLPFTFVNRTLSAISLGWKPHLNSYGVILLDIVKVPAVLIFIYFLDLAVIGAILSLIVSYIVSIISLVILNKTKLKSTLKLQYVRKWIKLSWLSGYIKFPNIVVLDVLVFSIITGSVVGLAYWTTAFTIGTMVRHSSQITRAVYPKLLGGGSKKILQENITRLFYFAFPMLAFSITFAKPALFALNPLYDVGALAVIFLTIRAFLKMLGDLFTQSLTGVEKVDIDENSTFKDYLKSKLFYLPTIKLIQRGVYIGSLIIGLIILIQLENSQIELVIWWSIIALVSQIPFTLYFYILVRKDFPLLLNRIAILKYSLSSLVVFGFSYFLIEGFLEYDESIFVFLPKLLLFIALGFGSYVGLTYLIDKNTRGLYKAIIKEIKDR
jgi:hypothetical protein